MNRKQRRQLNRLLSTPTRRQKALATGRIGVKAGVTDYRVIAADGSIRHESQAEFEQ